MLGGSMRTVTAKVRGHEVTIKRPDPLVIWLDMWVFQNIAKLGSGQGGDSRIVPLFEAVTEAVASGQAIVVGGAEEDEVYSYNWKHFRRTRLGLTRERNYLSWMDVRRAELAASMGMWSAGRSAMTIPATAVYNAETFRPEAEQPDFYVTVTCGTEEALRRSWAEANQRLADRIEAMRTAHRADGIEYGRWLEQELRAGADWPLRVLSRNEQGDATPTELAEAGRTLLELRGVARPLDLDEPGLLTRYLASDAALALPSSFVYSVLWADMVTGSERVRPGDSFDTQHLRLAVPYADIVVTDIRMTNRIRARKLDRQFGCRAFSIRDTDKVIALLEEAGSGRRL